MRLPDGKISEIITKSVKHGEFPKDLSVQINKEGGQPAKIHVKRGDKEWDVTEEKLAELPGDIKHHVEELLGKAMASYKAMRRHTGRQGRGRRADHADAAETARPPKAATVPQASTPPKPPTPQANRAMTVRTHHNIRRHGLEAGRDYQEA